MLIFFCLEVKARQLLGVRELQEEREREAASFLKAPRPPNSLLSISAEVCPLGPRFPPNLRGKPLQGEKNTAKQMQGTASQNVCVCV